MPSQSKNQQPAQQQPGDPLFNLHHAEAEAELARQNPVATTQAGLSADDRLVVGDDDLGDDAATGPVDRQGQRRGQQPTTPETGTGAGHH